MIAVVSGTVHAHPSNGRPAGEHLLIAEIDAALARIHVRFTSGVVDIRRRLIHTKDDKISTRFNIGALQTLHDCACDRISFDHGDDPKECVAQYVDFLETILRSTTDVSFMVDHLAQDAVTDARKIQSIIHISQAYPEDATKRLRKLATKEPK